VRILIDSDAHGVNTLHHVQWGVITARRAWLAAADVANTRPWPEFAALRKRVINTNRGQTPPGGQTPSGARS